MDEAKIRLSDAEMDLLTRPDWILTKNHILQKSMLLLGSVQENYARYLSGRISKFPSEIFKAGSKISKGENLEGLPYQVLDYPRLFEQNDIFAIRTLFWWGNFFSITLQLSGAYKMKYAGRIASAHSVWSKSEFHIAVGTDPWLHHFRKDNYQAISEYREEEFKMKIEQFSFLKLAAKLDISQWEKSPVWLQEKFEWIVDVLSD